MKITNRSLLTGRVVLRALAITLLAGVSSVANAQVRFDDAVDGNASSDGSAPTELTFEFGSNIVNGTVTNPDNTRNFYTFTIGEGQELSAINLDSISVVNEEGAPSDDPGFYALVAGSTSATP